MRKPSHPLAGTARTLLLAALVATLPAACAPGQAAELETAATADTRPLQADPSAAAWGGRPDPRWRQFDALAGDQKMQEAADLADRILDDARRNRRAAEWTRALVRTVQARVALHGYETAVRFLAEAEWPQDPVGRAVLGLYKAWTLQAYLDAYGWEIGQRERVEAKGPVDLKSWTAQQIRAEALAAFDEAWSRRASLGGLAVGSFAEWLEPNDYPEGIRPTVRDAVSYLRAEALADSSGWTPVQSNEVFRLDLGALLGPAAPAPAPAPDAHPLSLLAATLQDLEAWHLAQGRPEAALEAALQRLRHLHGAFDGAADRRRVRDALQARLSDRPDLPWSAAGTALWVEFRQAEDDPDARREARDRARACAAAHPGTPGGQQCAWWVAQLEHPSLGLEGMASDAPGRRSLRVTHRNLPAAHFRAWPVDLQRFLEKADDYALLPGTEEVERLMAGRPSHQWTADLPPTPDLREHATYVTPPLEGPGLYLVAVSGRADFRQQDNVRTGLFLAVGDLVLQHRAGPDTLEAEVVSGADGRPVAGAEVLLYRLDWRNRHKVQRALKTGPDGLATFSGERMQGQAFLVLARKGADVAVDPQQAWIPGTPSDPERTASLVFTDRSVYRPGQEVLFKVVAYQGRRGEARYRTLPNRPLQVTLHDANGQPAGEARLVTNARGTASGRIAIPAGRLLGAWSLRSSLEGQAALRVEEYKRPTFEAKVLDPETPLRLNRPAALKGEARYYFGLPVASGKVAWRVTREPQWPWWWWWRPAGSGAVQVVASGTASLGAEGTFPVTFTPAADEREAAGQGVTYRFRLVADVTDEGGETRTAERSFRLGFSAVEASLTLSREFAREGEGTEVDLRRTDLDGAPAPGDATWRLVRLAGPDRALLPADQPLPPPDPARPAGLATEGDRLRPRWDPDYDPARVLRLWPDGEEVARGDVRHDPKGVAAAALPGLAAGAYRLSYRTVDPFGTPYETSREFVVAGRETPVPLPALMAVQEGTVRVGGTARVLVHSGLPGQRVVVERWRDGRRLERRELVAGKSPSVLEFPATEADRGGYTVTMALLRDHQSLRFQRDVFVPWDDRELKVDFSTFRDLMRPGARETWTVKVTGPGKRDAAVAAAEVLAYMYDRSLDVFAPHHPPSTSGLYPGRTGAPWVRLSLGPAHGTWIRSEGFRQDLSRPDFTADRLKSFDGYGVGGPGARGLRHRMFKAGGRAMAMPAAAPMVMEGAMSREATAEESADAPADKKNLAAGTKYEFDGLLLEGRADDAGKAAPGADVPVRSDFRETAFFEPHLLTGPDGTVSLAFTVPDSVTAWNVWVHAVTSDLRGGSALRQARTVKDLMVRPYLPRFFREGDRAVLKVVVNNASDRPLSGDLDLQILDPATNRSLLAEFGLKAADARRPFQVPAGGGADLSFEVTVPARVGPVAVKAVATAGDLSDGELRPLPVLPGRLHLAQSRFVTLKDAGSRTMRFDDLARGDDPTLATEQLVVTVDAQLFYGVLSAVPYLVDYPYECSEQTLNRFLSTGILSSMFDRYPAVAAMAQQMAKRETRLEAFDAPDPNRKMALEETPWLVASRGGAEEPDDLLRVLDPRVAAAQRQDSLAKLQKAQTSSGGFPWFPGGPPSPYITLYVVHGFSKALEFGVEVPKDVVTKAFAYLHRHWLDEVVRRMKADDVGWEFVTFLGYVLSNFPDDSWTGGVFGEDDRKSMLAFSFKHWKQHSPYLKGYLALTLKRAGREADARKVWDSVMDSAKTAEDQGTFWAPEDRAWLWYNDTIESHAFALRTAMELTPADPRVDGLVLWLFLNKKLNHWKSTKATAEVVYSLAKYLRATERLGVREDATVVAGGQSTTFEFLPDRYTGKRNQVVIPGEKVDPARDATVTVSSTTKGLKFASATWHFATDRLPPEARGDFLAVTRTFYKRESKGPEVVLRPLADGEALAVGDEVEVHLSLRSKHALEYVHLRDPRGAGFEPASQVSRYRWDLGVGFYESVRDSGQDFFFDWLPAGEYTFKHRLRATLAGTFKVAPATVQPMYAPEFAAYSAGNRLSVGPAR